LDGVQAVLNGYQPVRSRSAWGGTVPPSGKGRAVTQERTSAEAQAEVGNEVARLGQAPCGDRANKTLWIDEASC
jgi:hypothetical protein